MYVYVKYKNYNYTYIYICNLHMEKNEIKWITELWITELYLTVVLHVPIPQTTSTWLLSVDSKAVK